MGVEEGASMKDMSRYSDSALGFINLASGFPCRVRECKERPLKSSALRVEHEITVHDLHYVEPPWTSKGIWSGNMEHMKNPKIGKEGIRG